MNKSQQNSGFTFSLCLFFLKLLQRVICTLDHKGLFVLFRFINISPNLSGLTGWIEGERKSLLFYETFLMNDTIC